MLRWLYEHASVLIYGGWLTLAVVVGAVLAARDKT